MSIYFEFLVFVSLISGLVLLWQWIAPRMGLRLSPQSELRIHLALVVVALLFPIKSKLIDPGWIPVHRSPVNSEKTLNVYTLSPGLGEIGAQLKTSRPETGLATPSIELNYNFLLWSLFLMGLIKFFHSHYRCWRLKKSSTLLKSLGGVKIYLSDKVSSPLSFRLLKFSYVIIPQSILVRNSVFQVSRWHEYQHLRRGDTCWAHLICFLKCMSFINPLVHRWIRRVHALQELCCDQRVISHHPINPKQYASALLAVFASAPSQKLWLSDLQMSWHGAEIKWRIKNMKNKYKTSSSRLLAPVVFMAIAYLSLSFTSHADAMNPLSLEEGNKLIASASVTSAIPLEMNPEILAQLNKFLKTEKGRSHTRKALKNYKGYKSMVLKTINNYNHPIELAAVGFIESGYRNLPQKHNRMKSAGLWQFIPGTALRYGLDVTKAKDERLIEDKATDAAMRYLGSNFFRFKSWDLALLSYYLGEEKVFKATRKANTKDAWRLLREGHLKDQGYLSKFYAAAIIMQQKNPLSI